jgi:serine/threonine-protein kinase
VAVTSGKQILGTPYYMSPEQVRGETLDPRADVYSLGATLYRALTGAPPFNGSSPMAVLSKHITDAVVPPSEKAPERALPPEADEIVLRAMAKNPAERYESAAAIQRDLERIVGAAAISSGFTSGAMRGPITAVGEAPTLALSESEAGSDPGSAGEGQRLRRQDLEDFERGLRRGKRLTRLALPLLIAVGGAGVFAVSRWHTEKPTSVEHEPNNTPGYANLLPSGRPVRGAIGAPGESAHGDVDYYRVPVGKGARVVRARVEGLPGTDLILELFDAQGRRIAKGDAHGRGGSEWIQPFSVGPAEAFVAVREVWVEGQPPTQDPNDTYALTVSWAAPAAGWEVEPNDWEAAATPVQAGTSVRGYLGEADDKDWYAITSPAAGRLALRVTVPAGVDVVLLNDPTSSAAKKAPINARDDGEDEETTLDVEAGKPALIAIARKPLGKNEKADDLTGLDAPYELTISASAASGAPKR